MSVSASILNSIPNRESRGRNIMIVKLSLSDYQVIFHHSIIMIVTNRSL